MEMFELIELQLTDRMVKGSSTRVQNCNSEGSIDCQRTVTTKRQLLSTLIVLPAVNAFAEDARIWDSQNWRFALLLYSQVATEIRK